MRDELKDLLESLAAGCLVSLILCLVLYASESSKLRIVGELQHQWTQPPSFWVNGVRLSVEDRPETQKWLEQHVGAYITVTVQ